MNPSDHLLEMTGISKRFAGIPALSQARFNVGHGEIHALVGQNGAGKSTLIKILTGYHAKDAGEIRFDGQPFTATRLTMRSARASAPSTRRSTWSATDR
jgi:monosaccharide-transporting ATPase